MAIYFERGRRKPYFKFAESNGKKNVFLCILVNAAYIYPVLSCNVVITKMYHLLEKIQPLGL